MRALRPLLLSALVVGIGVTILMEASIIGPRRVPGRGQATGYGAGSPKPLAPRQFVIDAVSSNGAFPVLPVALGAAVLVAAIGGWFLYRRRLRHAA